MCWRGAQASGAPPRRRYRWPRRPQCFVIVALAIPEDHVWKALGNAAQEPPDPAERPIARRSIVRYAKAMFGNTTDAIQASEDWARPYA
eukprot:4448156-Lingulodinium_polyedra.AAC.1